MNILAKDAKEFEALYQAVIERGINTKNVELVKKSIMGKPEIHFGCDNNDSIVDKNSTSELLVDTKEKLWCIKEMEVIVDPGTSYSKTMYEIHVVYEKIVLIYKHYSRVTIFLFQNL